MAEAPRHTLIERLLRECGVPEVGSEGIDAFLAPAGDVVLFFTEDPKKYPESADVAVILPELMQALHGRFRTAVVERASERALQKRFGFARWPALVFLRDGDLVGAITGMHDWNEFVQKAATLLDSPTRREVAAAEARENNRAAGPQELT